jgi:hypothetical protein
MAHPKLQITKDWLKNRAGVTLAITAIITDRMIKTQTIQVSCLVSYINERYGVLAVSKRAMAVTKVADDRLYHPIRDYLNALPPWDGIKRVESLLSFDGWAGKSDIGGYAVIVRIELRAKAAVESMMVNAGQSPHATHQYSRRLKMIPAAVWVVWITVAGSSIKAVNS